MNMQLTSIQSQNTASTLFTQGVRLTVTFYNQKAVKLRINGMTATLDCSSVMSSTFAYCFQKVIDLASSLAPTIQHVSHFT
jgi:hypothetical protein